MSTKDDTNTCIQLSRKTRDELADMGGKKDTYEDIIKGLMKFKKPIDSVPESTDTIQTRSNDD